MKFKCGPTIAERAAKEKAEQEKLHANFVWKPWFAWRPIKVGDVISPGGTGVIENDPGF